MNRTGAPCAVRIRNGTSVAVFPEGTRSYDGVMRTFKKGSFRRAIRSGAPIVPMTIIGSHMVMKRGQVTVYPKTVKLVIDRPIPVAGLDEDQAAALMEQVRSVVSRNLERG